MNSTSGQYEIVLSDVEPTECLNNADTFNAASLTVVREGVKVGDGTPTHPQATLGAYKAVRYNEINAKTDYLVHTGYVTFDGVNFSTSFTSQFNMTAIKGNPADFTFPKEITTYEQDTYDLASTDVDALWTAMKDSVDAQIAAGRALKKSVTDAVDRAGVDAVVDNR